MKILAWAAWMIAAALVQSEKGAGYAAADDAPVTQRGPVELNRCRLKLIDKVTLASGQAGILKFVEPTEGLDVERDQIVARLEDGVARAKLNRAAKEAGNDIQVRYARMAFKLASVELQQAEQANTIVPNAIPELEVNRLRLAASKSELQIEQAEHALEVGQLVRDEAAAELNTYEIKAPFAGVVTRVYKKQGEAVRQGDPILDVVNTERIRAEGHVDIAEIWNVKLGDRVELSLDIPDVDLPVEKETFIGRIVFVDVEAEPVSRRVKVWADLDNQKNILRAGLTAKMKILPAVALYQAEQPAVDDSTP